MNGKILAISFILLTSCKTQEEIQREKMITQVNEKIDTSINTTQKQVAETSSRLDSFDERISKLNGQIEELAHKTNQNQNEQVQKLIAEMGVLKEDSKNTKIILEDLKNKFDSQKSYLDQVVKTIEDFTNKAMSAKEVKKKETVTIETEEAKVAESPLENANALIKKKNYDEARVILHEISENKKTKLKDQARALFLLGELESQEKRLDAALVFYSRVATEFPKTTEAPLAFFNLSKIFEKQKKKEQAKMALEELVNRFPKHPKAKEAKKLISKLVE
jgi:TolA-binding protein